MEIQGNFGGGHFRDRDMAYNLLLDGEGSGKTSFVRDLLEKQRIQTAVQRIVFLYKRWQPLSDLIKRTVVPRVEFIQGIPIDLEQDSFFNPRVRNMIILDDLMTACSKDPRIGDLFTEGSHHRNLSVVAINQNVFHNKSPTQRRNCHYLVLFNNPVDKQQIMTLARQMYPGNTQYFMRYFKEATSQPYGHLVVYLKPTTPEHSRMRSDIFNIKEISEGEQAHSVANLQPEQTYSERENVYKTQFEDVVSDIKVIKTEDHCSDKIASCDDCGVLFENSHDLQKHVKNWCPETRSMKRKLPEEDYVPNKRMKYEPEEESAFENSDEESAFENNDEENDVFMTLASIAKENNEEEWNDKVEKYEKGGLSDAEAQEKADKKLREDDMRDFMNRYAKLIQYILQLRNGHVHGEIMDTIEKNI